MKKLLTIVSILSITFFGKAQNVDLTNTVDYIRVQKQGHSGFSRAFGLNGNNQLYIGSIEHTIGDIYFYNKGSNHLMTIKPNGNVGIGTTDPKRNLQINGTSEASSATQLNGHLVLSSSTTGLVNTFGIHTAESNPYSWIQSGHKTYNNTFDLALNPRGGNVGIGITNPKGNLQINGTSEASSATQLNGHLVLSSNTTGLVHTFGIHTAASNPYSWIQSGHKLYNTTFDLSLNPRGGNVGIGTSNPDAKLTVAGNIHAREVKVTVNAGADFVFDKDYDLPSLEEVEHFVTQHKHLPEIASEKEMQDNGLQLAEMNIKLLQKIEELTLYTIQQDKEIKALKAMVTQWLEAQH